MVEPFAHDSPLRFGANALGQQEDMWLAFGYAQIPPLAELHISPERCPKRCA